MAARSVSPHVSPQGSLKRQRTSAACERCRKRKVACDGSVPCLRCAEDAAKCIYEARPERSALTRVRMTELEEALSLHELLWDSLLPAYPLEQACRDAVDPKGGIASVLAKARSHLPNHSHQHLNSPLARPDLRSIPPTRAGSPSGNGNGLSLKPVYVDHALEAGSYEWHEDQNLTRDPDSTEEGPGMGGPSNSSSRGMSYMGLSSAATFLNVIRRLCSKDIFLPTPTSNPAATSPFDVNTILAWFGNVDTAPPPIPVDPLPRPPRLPPARETKALVDAYFAYFHTFTPLVHEPTIRAQLSGAIPIAPKGSTSILFNMIFAMGALDSATSEDADTGMKYYQLARAELQRDMMDEGSLPLVQGLAIMANYLQRSNKPNAGYICLGWAIRMALALGLHAPNTSAQATPLEREIRTRVWWALVGSETGCSITFGRPHALSAATLGAMPLPINCDDEDFTVSSTEPPSNAPYPTLYTANVFQARLAQAVAATCGSIFFSASTPTVNQIIKCDERIASIVGSLPDFMQVCVDGPHRLARATQIWRARDFRAILYRPVLLAAAWDSTKRHQMDQSATRAIQTCRQLAMDNLNDIGQFVRGEGDMARGGEWYTLFFAFQSALTILLSVVWEPQHEQAPIWREALLSTAGWFRNLRSMSKLGKSYARILENIVTSESPHISVDPLPQPPANLTNWNSLLAADAFQFPDHNMLDVDRYCREIWGTNLQQ